VSGSHAGQLVLVTGATGYIGGRLVPRLLEAGQRSRWSAISPSGCRSWCARGGRVEEVWPDRLLRLPAEMKLPGRAWLEFEVVPEAGGRSVLSQTALFAPKASSAGCTGTPSIPCTP